MNAAGVGAVGAGMAAGAGAVGGAMNIAAPAATGIGSAPAVGTPSIAPGAGAIPASLSSLVQTLQGFATAEILLALMMMGDNQNKSQNTGDAAMAMLAGLALAGNLGGMASNMGQATAGVAATGGAGGGVGLQINLQI